MIVFLNKIKIVYDNYTNLLETFNRKDVKTITCINQHYYNLLYNNSYYNKNLIEFDLIHPDGIGMKFIPLILKKKVQKSPILLAVIFI